MLYRNPRAMEKVGEARSALGFCDVIKEDYIFLAEPDLCG
jgi:hypothetical protein